MTRLAQIVMLAALVIGVASPALGQVPVRQVEIDMIPAALQAMVDKAESPQFEWNGVDTSTYTEWAPGAVGAEPQIRLTGVSYLYVPFTEPADLSEVLALPLLDFLTTVSSMPPDFPEGSVPGALSEPMNGVWVVLGQLSQPLTPELCVDHHWRFYVTVANDGRVPFEANERRPGSIFDGGDVLYGSQMHCDGVSTFVDATNETGGAGAWPGFVPMFYNGATIVGAIIPDQLFGPDAMVRTSLEERPPVGEQGDADTALFTTDAPVGQPLLDAAGLDRWPECAAEIGIGSVEDDADPTAAGEGGAPAEETPPGDTAQGSNETTGQTSTDDEGSGIGWLFGLFPVLLFFALVVFIFMRRKVEDADEENTGWSEEARMEVGVLGDLPPADAFEPSGGIPHLAPTSSEVQRVAGEILDKGSDAAADPGAAAAEHGAAYQVMLEALALTGWIGFREYVDKSDAALSTDVSKAFDPPAPIPVDDLCERLRDLCNEAKAEFERRRNILNQKEAAYAQLQALASQRRKELRVLDDFLQGGGDSIESEGDRVDEIDRRLYNRFGERCRSAYEADLAAAGNDRDAREAASRRFDEAMADARTPEARQQRRENASQTRDEVANDLADAEAKAKKAKEERDLARHAVDKAAGHVAKVCAKADECDREVADAAEREEEIRRKLREQQALDDEERDRRHRQWDEEDRSATSPAPRPTPPPPSPAPGALPPDTEAPIVPHYLESRPCAEGTEKLLPIAARSDVAFIDPSELITIRFKRVINPALSAWLKQHDASSYAEGAGVFEGHGKYSEGRVPAAAVLGLSDSGFAALVRGDDAASRAGFEGAANMSIVVSLTVNTGTLTCLEVWRCNAEGKYAFAEYRCRPVGREFPSRQREREFNIHGLNVLYLQREVQGWIRSFVPEHQPFCKDCESGRLRH